MMMNLLKIMKFQLFFFFLFVVQVSFAQIVTTKEAFPNGDSEITIIVDLKLAIDGRAKSLLGKTSDVFLWSGAGIDDTGDAFKYQPAGQTDFSKPFDPGKMTSLGNDKWSITLTPRKYYYVPADQVIKKIGIVVKNGAGNAQTEDFFLKLFDPRLGIDILQPSQSAVIVGAKDSFPLKIRVSKTSDIKITGLYNLLEKQITFDFGSFMAVDSLNTIIDLSKIMDKISGGLKLEILATSKTEKTTQTLFVVIKPDVIKEALPKGINLGPNYLENNQIILSFLAPQKNFVYLLGDFNNWEQRPEYLFKKDPSSDIFWVTLNNLEAGKEYAYQFLVDGNLQVADPFAHKILDPNNDKNIPATTYPNPLAYPANGKGIVSVLQNGQKPYEWKATEFKRPKSEQLVVYEMLIRDFTVEGNFKAAQARIPYLKTLGINAIELMPVSEFTNNDSWGYNPTFYNAVDKAYGTKNDLKNFIDECHKNGMAVIIDMVLNQADEAFPYVKMYFDGAQPAKDSPFFNQTATHPFSVFRDFNHESTATQLVVDEVNKYWLQEFKIDGFRFDLSKGFTQKVNTDVGLWSAYDASRIAIWKRIYDKIRKVDQSAYVILEHFAANTEEKELSDYGMMFWGNANGDYRNTIKGGSSNLYYLSHKERGWAKADVIGYMESHDEERLIFDILKNGQAISNYNTKDLPTALDRAKAVASVFFLTQGPKMIWQFGELGYDISIDQNGRTGKKPVKWEYFDEANRKKLYLTYAELIKLKKTFDIEGAIFTYKTSGKTRQIKIESATNTVFVIANFDLIPKAETIEFGNSKWFDYFTSQEVTIPANEKMELKPGEFHIYTKNKIAITEPNLVPWAPFTKEVILGEEQLELPDFKLFPNPSSTIINVQLVGKVGEHYKIELQNMAGQSIQMSQGLFIKKEDIAPIDIKKIPAGIYFLEVLSEGKSRKGKFIKQ
jgi:glycosidase